MKGNWDGSFKDNGKSERFVVVKGVDRERWVTISKIAVPLKVGAAVAAEVAAVRVLTSIFDLIFCTCLSVQNINSMFWLMDAEMVIDDRTNERVHTTARMWRARKDSMEVTTGRTWHYHCMNRKAMRTRTSVVGWTTFQIKSCTVRWAWVPTSGSEALAQGHRGVCE